MSADEYINHVLEVERKTAEWNHIFMYDGFINQEVCKFFSEQVKVKIEEDGIEYLQGNRIYHVMVECFQNIVRHSDNPETGELADKNEIRGYMAMGETEDGLYYVTTGNVIGNKKVEKVQSWLDNVNSLDKDGVKKLYKQILRENRLNERGGASLGFVDMKKRTGNNIEYFFDKLNDKASFLILTVRIAGK